MKGYEVGYSNPKNGTLIINKDGVIYIVKAEPVLNYDGTLGDAMNDLKYLFK